MGLLERVVKSVVSGLWPEGRSTVMPTGNTLTSLERFGLPYLVSSLGGQQFPHFQQLIGFDAFLRVYQTNPVIFAIINILSTHGSNGKWVAWDKNKDRMVERKNRSPIPQSMYRIIDRPNAMQSWFTFLQQRRTFQEMYGNVMTYANSPIGFTNGKPNIMTVQSLSNPWPNWMEYKAGGSFFDAQKRSDVIKEWRFKYGEYEKVFTGEEVLLQAEPNTDVNMGVVFGRSKIANLSRPVSNIDMAYESRNVIMRNRGMDVIISPNAKDESGNVPMDVDEIKELKDAIDGYGTLEGQKWAWFAPYPVSAIPINRDVRKLGLFEEIATDAMICANVFGVPEILLKLYLQGATFENQQQSIQRLYTGTVIPKSDLDALELSTFLGLDGTDYCYKVLWDHIPELQTSDKDKYTAYQLASSYLEKMFLMGGITLNQWLKELDLPDVGPDGDRKIFDYEPEQLEVMGIKAPAPPAPPPGAGAPVDGEEVDDTEEEVPVEEQIKRFKLNGHQKIES